MPATNLLNKFGLSRNPFTDRTAEKTSLDPTSLYQHSDLQGFAPSERTYIVFGRRGSGKTTIRLQMMDAYKEYNDAAEADRKSKGHFVVDLCRPGHLTACLREFQVGGGRCPDFGGGMVERDGNDCESGVGGCGCFGACAGGCLISWE